MTDLTMPLLVTDARELRLILDHAASALALVRSVDAQDARLEALRAARRLSTLIEDHARYTDLSTPYEPLRRTRGLHTSEL